MNILTFDIEEWFHVLDNESTKTENEWSKYQKRLDKNIEQILGLLGKYNQKATFFCLGWVAREYPNIIRSLSEKGYEIASHSDKHQLAYEQNKKEFAEDIRSSIESIEDIIGKKVRSYRAPGFSIKSENKWVFEILAENGIEIDCSIFPAKRSHGGFAAFGHARPVWIETNGIRLKEFPINLYYVAGKSLVFSGGGYFRLLPYSIIAYMVRDSDYVMTYFHPRDFDKEQPLIKELNFMRRFKSYYGLKNTFKKLEMLINEFDFVDLSMAEKKNNWDEAVVVNL